MTMMQHRFTAGAHALLLAFTLLLTGLMPGAAQAQGADVDPPGRVARLADLQGQVWLYDPDSGDWVGADRNRPLTSGDRIATDAGARAELQIGSTSLRLDGASELEIVQLDDERVALQLHDGSVIARVRDPAGAGELELATEEGRFVTLRAGTYRVDRRDARSDLTVYNGQARYEGPNSGLNLDAGRRAQFWIDSGGVAQYSQLAPLNDAFVAWSGERDRRVVGSDAERYVSPEMTGAAELDAYGRWEQTPDYGPVWIPTAVTVDWAPYSHGHWTWVRPWGWTWVDDAPWGFAPFHYGRWVYARNRWGWAPGTRVARPVYAPALVGWVGGGEPRGNGAFGGGPAVGWFPLAPREVYVPGYRVSSRYVERLNFTSVGNVSAIRSAFGNPQGPREFENRHAPRGLTVVPGNVFAERRPVAPAAAQFRQSPGGREFGNGPGRGQMLLAPPVASPSLAARPLDRRDVRPPPGVAGRPGFAQPRPGQAPRDRNDAQGDRRAPPSFDGSPRGFDRNGDRGGDRASDRGADRSIDRAERQGNAPGVRPGMPNAQAAPLTPPANTGGMPQSSVRPQTASPGEPPNGNQRPNGSFDRGPRERPNGDGTSGFNGRGNPPSQGATPAPMQSPPSPQIPQPQQQQPPPQSVRPTVQPQAAPPVQESPMMRPMPVQRDDRRDDRRGDGNRFDERRGMPRGEALTAPTAPVSPNTPTAPEIRQPRREERPQAPPVQMQRPMDVQPAARPAEVQRPAAPAIAPAPPRAEPARPESVRPQRPDGPRGDDRRGEPRER